jgi:RNA polymerase sigma-70 factor (ECF subfamily)
MVRVASYLLGIQKKFLSLVAVKLRPVLINGQPGLIGYLDTDSILSDLLAALEEGRREGAEKGGAREKTKHNLEFYQRSIKKGEPIFAIALTLAEKQIQEIDIVVNPEKLRHIPVNHKINRAEK